MDLHIKVTHGDADTRCTTCLLIFITCTTWVFNLETVASVFQRSLKAVIPNYWAVAHECVVRDP